MFKTVKRIIDWCGECKGRLYAGFVMTFFSHIFAAMPLALAAYTVGLLIDAQAGGPAFDTAWIWKCIVIQVILVFFRFLFDYFRARLQEPIGYQLTARDRLAIGDALKRVSLGYFQSVSTGNILNSITTGLSTLEGMGIRMIDNFVGGYLNFLVIFLALAVCSPVTALIALAAAAVSFGCMLIISHYSRVNAPVEAEANREMTGAVLEYARGLAVVKSFGKSGAAMQSVTDAVKKSKRIHLKIEWGYLPGNALHLLALKCGSVALALAAALECLHGQTTFSMALMFIFFSFSIFASLEPISDSAHTLGVIDDAMDQLGALRGENLIDADGKDIRLSHYDITSISAMIPGRCCRTSASRSPRRPRRPSSAPPAPARPRSAACSRGSMTRSAARSASAGTICASSPATVCSLTSPWCSRTCICSTIPSARTSSSASRTPRRRR